MCESENENENENEKMMIVGEDCERKLMYSEWRIIDRYEIIEQFVEREL